MRFRSACRSAFKEVPTCVPAAIQKSLLNSHVPPFLKGKSKKAGPRWPLKSTLRWPPTSPICFLGSRYSYRAETGLSCPLSIALFPQAKVVQIRQNRRGGGGKCIAIELVQNIESIEKLHEIHAMEITICIYGKHTILPPQCQTTASSI